ncbi:hypothetical protein DFJ58DRAFT_869396 [Suillus subalutaceus]|uniref:uncharacterized protein n=1 Tax=Suillus subalutaceus TaxID=48586 RepID=UPI001B86C5C8|nr:uncharacterized protein DFJ58DRAFT_869396 [Suillus subalutaceus]KAG1834005.1 hypothetical protein DFJ58DRAFT_869396 [Suillus subalutaceus]
MCTYPLLVLLGHHPVMHQRVVMLHLLGRLLKEDRAEVLRVIITMGLRQVNQHSHTRTPQITQPLMAIPLTHLATKSKPSGGLDEENYKSNFSAHAHAYGSGHDDKPMANDATGAAAAVEARKIAAANNQSGDRPQKGGRPQGGFHPDADAPHARPSAGLSSGAQHPSASPSSQASFSTRGSQGKSQAMQSASATAMRSMGEYKSTGKVNMEPGEMQKLMGLAMSLF